MSISGDILRGEISAEELKKALAAENYYVLLGLETTASVAEIKKQVIQLLRKYHPDKAANKDIANEIAALINAAADVLVKDPKAKAAYDAKLATEATATIVPPSCSVPLDTDEKHQFYQISPTHGVKEVISAFHKFAQKQIDEIPKLKDKPSASGLESQTTKNLNLDQITPKKEKNSKSILEQAGYSVREGMYQGKKCIILTFPNAKAMNDFIKQMLQSGMLLAPIKLDQKLQQSNNKTPNLDEPEPPRIKGP